MLVDVASDLCAFHWHVLEGGVGGGSGMGCKSSLSQ